MYDIKNRFIPIQRTAMDGKTWWVVYDTIKKKYSPLLCFGKYRTKKDCSIAIKNALENCLCT